MGGVGGWARELDCVNDSSKSGTYEWRVKMETTTDIPTATVHVKIIQKRVPTTITYAAIRVGLLLECVLSFLSAVIPVQILVS